MRSPPDIDKLLGKKTYVQVATSRVTTSCPDEEHWSVGLTVADVMRQFGIEPNSSMTTDGKFQSLDGTTYESSSSESDEAPKTRIKRRLCLKKRANCLTARKLTKESTVPHVRSGKSGDYS